MKSGFRAPIEPKGPKPSPKPVDGKKSPWDFSCPEYDQRSSCFVNAGTHYGVGINQPVGHEGNPKERAPTLPYGTVNTMKVSDKG